MLEAFASFGFCKAHAAAFALPTYQSAWLKTHWPAHFLAGVLTHDPGMYPKRLILDDARQFGIAVLGLDVNASGKEYVVEQVGRGRGELRHPARAGGGEGHQRGRGGPDRRRPARSTRSPTSGTAPRSPGRCSSGWCWPAAFDSVYGIGSVGRRPPRAARSPGATCCSRSPSSTGTPGRWSGPAGVAGWPAAGLAGRGDSGPPPRPRPAPPTPPPATAPTRATAPTHPSSNATRSPTQGVWAKAAAQSKATRTPRPVTSVQLTLDLGDEPGEGPGEVASGLPEMSAEERMKAELEILGLDASRHVVDSYAPFLDALGVTRSKDLLSRRSKAELLVAGVKVATQTPPIRSGRRVIFLTLDDATGPVDATFFEDAQGPYAATVFHSWLLVVRGELRRTGRRGVSLRATGCWALPDLYAVWQAAPTSADGVRMVRELMAVVPEGFADWGRRGEEAVAGAAESRSTRPVMSQPRSAEPDAAGPGQKGAAGGMGRRRVLVHSSGFKMSPYSDIKPAGEDTKDVARKLWHRSPGSAG